MKKSLAIILSIILVLAITFPAAALSTISVKSIKLNSSKITLKVGQTSNLKVTFTPANTTQKSLTYATGNKKIATVNGSGKITAVSSGTTIITVYASNKKILAKCNVTITKIAEPVKLRVMLSNGDETRKLINSKYIQANLKSELPDYQVEVELVPDGYIDKLKVLNSTGELPDVFMSMGGTMLAPFIRSKSLLDLLPIITKDGYADKVKMKNLIEPYTDGKLYGLDPGNNAYFAPRLFYHKDLFTKYGINVPTTFDEFMSVCKTLIEKGLVPVSTYGKDGWAVNEFLLNTFIIAEKPEVAKELNQGKTDFSNPVVQSALKRIQTMAAEGVFQPNVTTMEYGAMQELFTSKKAAMYMMNSWALPDVAKDSDVDYFNFPQVKPSVDMNKSTQIYGANLGGYVVSSKTKNPKAAAKLAEFLCMQEAKFFNAEQKSPAGLETGISLEGASPLMAKSLKQIEESTVKVNVIMYNIIKAKTGTDMGVAGAKLLTGKYSAEQYAKDVNASFLDGFKAD